MSDVTIKIFVGTDEAGERLKLAIKAESNRRYRAENMSRFLIEDFCEKYGYDLRTGLPGKCPTGAPQKNYQPSKKR